MIVFDAPTLTAQEEAQLADRIRQGDKHAREELVLANIRLVVYVAKRFLHKVNTVFDFDDLIQEGYIGLVKAVDKFDPSRGRFSTCAGWWIIATIREALLYAKEVYIPVRVLPSLHAIQEMEGEHGERSTDEIARQLNLPHDIVAHLRLFSHPMCSLDTPLKYGSETLYADVLPDEASQHAYEAVEEQEQVEKLLRCLTLREWQVVSLVYGLGQDGLPMSLTDVSDALGICSQRVSQVHAKALRKMRARGDSRE